MLPRSPSSSTFVMLSNGMPIFVNQAATASLPVRFHDADDFALGQVGKAAVTFDGWIVLRRLCKLADLIRGEFSGRNGVGAHEFCHNTLLSGFVVIRRVGRIGYGLSSGLSTTHAERAQKRATQRKDFSQCAQRRLRFPRPFGSSR